jgi:hypothetical protein
MKFFIASIVLSMVLICTLHGQDIAIWTRFEKEFTSAKDYNNPVYDLRFSVQFTAPSGKVKNVQGFWDGRRSWKVRFMPDEKGTWHWNSQCPDKSNNGLAGKSGSFTCTANNSSHKIYKNGAITRSSGLYYLEHADGTPFFWTACTAWNGTLKSTDEEWKYYLDNRVANRYSVIQFVTTQWRGGDKNSLGQVAFQGSGVISINPEFFQLLDKKIDHINQAGLLAAPVLLWALPTYTGRYLSPGYYLPEEEAILLARYMVARYGANHVVWILGGDGKYLDSYEQRWKNIGRGVFGDEHPGLVALHPSGKMWLGDAYANEEWLDIVGYQTGHNNADPTLRWITKGPVASGWDRIPPKVFINMEPVYEEIRPEVTPEDVRNASYWSVLSTPTSGITYGANGIWPWLREGEEILNHSNKGETTSRWMKSLDLPGSVQIGYLSAFFQSLTWWELKPAPELLVEQPGDTELRKFISVSRSGDRKTIVVYVPDPHNISLYNFYDNRYDGKWFDAVANKTTKASISYKNGILTVAGPPGNNDHMLVLNRK